MNSLDPLLVELFVLIASVLPLVVLLRCKQAVAARMLVAVVAHGVDWRGQLEGQQVKLLIDLTEADAKLIDGVASRRGESAEAFLTGWLHGLCERLRGGNHLVSKGVIFGQPGVTRKDAAPGSLPEAVAALERRFAHLSATVAGLQQRLGAPPAPAGPQPLPHVLRNGAASRAIGARSADAHDAAAESSTPASFVPPGQGPCCGAPYLADVAGPVDGITVRPASAG